MGEGGKRLLDLLAALISVVSNQTRLEVLKLIIGLAPLPTEIKDRLMWLLGLLEAATDPNIQLSAEALLISQIRAEFSKVGITIDSQAPV